MSLQENVNEVIQQTPVIDMHTHLFPSELQTLCLTGIDELLTYHYLVSESFLWLDMDYSAFFELSKKEQAEIVWETLFVKRSPISEAAQGILTILNGLDIPYSTSLEDIRHYFASIEKEGYVEYLMSLAGVSSIVMTNNPFDREERAYWKNNTSFPAETFIPALRVDSLLSHWPEAAQIIREDGFPVSDTVNMETIESVKQFLRSWIQEMQPVYVAASLPWDFPQRNVESVLLKDCILAVCREFQLPLSLMIGTKRGMNPELQIAGDGTGAFQMQYLENLCVHYPDQKFLITMLSRENQYELTVLAQKFRNVMVFGCWWYLNTPQFMKEITQMRLSQLGLRFIPQHSDCRVMEQLIYKWKHFKEVFSALMYDHYLSLEKKGVHITRHDIENDIHTMFQHNFWTFVNEK
ncbi:glucuronate isomerase [Salibacterium aidingense]|uniref:glucuronate isomerase n=1 Tax=Salibacterium aidingense TaxID=384933 RepID=UPI003BEBBF0B